MNSPGAGDYPDAPAEDIVGQAVRLAGSRPAVPPEALAVLKQAAHHAWRTKVEDHAAARRRAQRFRGFALAATLVFSAGLTYLLLPAEYWPLGLLQPPAATVELSSDSLFVPGAEIKAGTVVETSADSRLALRLHTGASLRLDATTRLELHSAERLTLHRGAVYLDSGPGNTTIAVQTPLGIARDIGTQFEVRLVNDGLRLAVREGEVRLEQPAGTHAALAGTILTVDAEGHVQRASIPAHGDAWAWVLNTAPTFELEGSSIWEFLTWVTRETGWRLQTTDPGLQRRLQGIMVHGSVEGLRPDEAVEVVLPGAGLEFEVDDGALILRAR